MLRRYTRINLAARSPVDRRGAKNTSAADLTGPLRSVRGVPPPGRGRKLAPTGHPQVGNEIYAGQNEFIARRLICAVPLTRMFFLPHKSWRGERPRNTKTLRSPVASKERTDPALRKNITVPRAFPISPQDIRTPTPGLYFAPPTMAGFGKRGSMRVDIAVSSTPPISVSLFLPRELSPL